MSNIRSDILFLLERNARLTAAEIAVSLGLTEDAVAKEIAKLEKEQVICGYSTLINWSHTDTSLLTALIEVKVTPARGKGFDGIAERIYRFEEVKSVFLMSGDYDLAVTIEGRSLQEIASFVSDKLATMESVLSTATHFVLRKYKDHGVIMADGDDEPERMIVSP